jgi:hypothetical protein
MSALIDPLLNPAARQLDAGAVPVGDDGEFAPQAAENANAIDAMTRRRGLFWLADLKILTRALVLIYLHLLQRLTSQKKRWNYSRLGNPVEAPQRDLKSSRVHAILR